MTRRIAAFAVVALALGSGVAFAATQLSSSDGTEVCVNNTNGLVRVASPCREGEHSLTIGAGGSSVVVRNGTFANVPWGTTSAGVKLPLTGVTLAGKCESQAANPPYLPSETGLGRLLITSDTTMAALTDSSFSGGTVAGTSLLTDPATTAHDTGIASRLGPTTLVVANGATATITFGAQVDAPARTCTYFWQAIEAPN
jgi:hypothetical protein